MKTEKLEDYTLTYDDSPEAKERLFEIMLKAFKKLGHFKGDSIGQSDSTYEDAPEILTEAAEEGFRFNRIWND